MDIGSISTKGVVLDQAYQVIAEEYIWTEGNPIAAVKNLLGSLKESLGKLNEGVEVCAVGTTGSARKLAGVMLGADAVKNEITAHGVGTLSRYPDARTIFEIGGQDAKLILINNGVIVDYAMNTLCAAGTGAFLSSQAKRLGIAVEEMGDMALRSLTPAKIAARCTVFAESDMVHKAQSGYRKEDLVAGLCTAVVTNYLNNLGKGKVIQPPVVFQGGVSKNPAVARAFEKETGFPVIVDENSHLMGAIGAAILAQRAAAGKVFDFRAAERTFSTRAYECGGCANQCEVVCFYQDGVLLDTWGNRCPNYDRKKAALVS